MDEEEEVEDDRDSDDDDDVTDDTSSSPPLSSLEGSSVVLERSRSRDTLALTAAPLWCWLGMAPRRGLRLGQLFSESYSISKLETLYICLMRNDSFSS